MLDVGFFEIVIVALACLLIVGPERLPVVFKTLGTPVVELRIMFPRSSDVEKERIFQYEVKDELKISGKRYGRNWFL